MITLSEAIVEQAALDWLEGLGSGVAHGPDITPDTPNAERSDYGFRIGPRVYCDIFRMLP